MLQTGLVDNALLWPEAAKYLQDRRSCALHAEGRSGCGEFQDHHRKQGLLGQSSARKSKTFWKKSPLSIVITSLPSPWNGPRQPATRPIEEAGGTIVEMDPDEQRSSVGGSHAEHRRRVGRQFLIQQG